MPASSAEIFASNTCAFMPASRNSDSKNDRRTLSVVLTRCSMKPHHAAFLANYQVLQQQNSPQIGLFSLLGG
jgi:hypothetical protein